MKKFTLMILLNVALVSASCGDRKEKKQHEPEKPKNVSSEPEVGVIFDKVITPNGTEGFYVKSLQTMVSIRVRLFPNYFLCTVGHHTDQRFVIQSHPITVDNEERRVFFEKDAEKQAIGQVIYTKLNNQWEYLALPCDIYGCEIRAKLIVDRNNDMTCEIRVLDTSSQNLMFSGSDKRKLQSQNRSQ